MRSKLESCALPQLDRKIEKSKIDILIRNWNIGSSSELFYIILELNMATQ